MALPTERAPNGTLADGVDTAAALQHIAPSNPEVLYTVYHFYSALAASALDSLKRTDPESARFHQVLAEAALTQDQFPNAIAELRKAIASNPEIPGIRLKLGTTLLMNAQDANTRAEARRAFQTELTHDPQNYQAEYELDEVDRLAHHPVNAEAHYRKALAEQPNFANAQAALGNLLAPSGHSTEALPYFVEASRLDPTNESYHYRLARLYQTLGRTDDFRREMQAFQRFHQP